MVTIAKPEMTAQLHELWNLGFGDSRLYTDYIFKNIAAPNKILVYKKKRKSPPEAMLCMEPMTLIYGEKSIKAMYMYAFTTHPDSRGQGIGGELLEGFHRYCKKHGYMASVLKPGEDSLFKYYGDRGYATQFSVKEIEVLPEQIKPTGDSSFMISRSLDMLESIRNTYFLGNQPFVKWSSDYLKFVDLETRFMRDGEVVQVSCGNKKGYLVYRLNEGTAEITEFAVDPVNMDDALWLFHQRINAKKYILRLSSDYDITDTTLPLPFAMIKWYDSQGIPCEVTKNPNGYISHVMD